MIMKSEHKILPQRYVKQKLDSFKETVMSALLSLSVVIKPKTTSYIVTGFESVETGSIVLPESTNNVLHDIRFTAVEHILNLVRSLLQYYQ